MKFTAEVKDGKMTLHDKSGFNRFISELEGNVWLEVKQAPAQRSHKQNGYYRAMVREAGNEFGYTENEMHKTFKDLFEVSSTKDLTIPEFSDYLDRIIRHCAQLGYPLQDPRGR